MFKNLGIPLNRALKVNLIIFGLDLLSLPFFAILLKVDAYNLLKTHLSTMLFLESCVVLFVGGLIVMSSSIFVSKVREHMFNSREKWTLDKHNDELRKANPLLFLGLLLFLESLIASFLYFLLEN